MINSSCFHSVVNYVFVRCPCVYPAVGLLCDFRSYFPISEAVPNASVLVFLFTCFWIGSHWHWIRMLNKWPCKEIHRTPFLLKILRELPGSSELGLGSPVLTGKCNTVHCWAGLWLCSQIQQHHHAQGGGPGGKLKLRLSLPIWLWTHHLAFFSHVCISFSDFLGEGGFWREKI